MMTPFLRSYARLTLAGLATATAIAALGYAPTLRLGGPEAIAPMLAGIGVSLVAGCISTAPITRASLAEATGGPQAILLATTLRFLVALVLTASILLSGWFDRTVLVIWVGISYLSMLLMETLFAVRLLGPRGRGPTIRGDAPAPEDRDDETPDRPACLALCGEPAWRVAAARPGPAAGGGRRA